VEQVGPYYRDKDGIWHITISPQTTGGDGGAGDSIEEISINGVAFNPFGTVAQAKARSQLFWIIAAVVAVVMMKKAKVI
jgi:hypothetical protein